MAGPFRWPFPRSAATAINASSLQAPTEKPRASSTTAHRARQLARIADPTLPRKVYREDNEVRDAFIDSKRDRRQIRRSAFVSKIVKARASRPRSGAAAAVQEAHSHARRVG